MRGLHDWFESLGTDYGRYGRWPPLPPSVPRLPNQSFSPSYQFIHKTFFKLHQNTSWLWSSFFQISCSAQNARLFPIPLQILILFLKPRGKYHFCVRHLLTERRLHPQVCPCDMLSSPMTLICQFEILPFAIVLQFFYRGGDVQYCTNCHFLQKIRCKDLDAIGNWYLQIVPGCWHLHNPQRISDEKE